MPFLILIGAVAVVTALANGLSTSTPPAPLVRSRAPRILRRMAGFEAEARVAVNAYNHIARILHITNAPDLEFAPGAEAHYDPNRHVVAMDLRWVRSILHRLCDDRRCAIHAITAFMAHEMRHAMQVHRPGDGLATRRAHEDDADVAIGVVLAHLDLDPAEVHHIMLHLGGPGDTEHSPGWKRADSVWSGYYSALGA